MLVTICILISLIFSIILHELAHGGVAFLMGDSTAKYAGRLTLNPVSHIDPIGSILIPGLLLISGTGMVFGWAKPVPINPSRFKYNPRVAMSLVALAGPLSNICLAILAAILIRSELFRSPEVLKCLIFFTSINLLLAIFNLIPIPPLDGSKVLISWLPIKSQMFLWKFERYGMILLFALLFFGAFQYFILPIWRSLLGLLIGF